MKALSLWQPWASLVASGHKKIETRCWSTRYRGPLAIHATKTLPRFCGNSQLEPEFLNFLSQLKIDRWNLPCGAVLCTADLIDVERVSLDLIDDLSEQELTFGNYEEGRYAWFLDHVKPFPMPIPAKGNRLLWEWNEAAAGRRPQP